MKRIHLFWRILRVTHTDKMLLGFLLYFFATAVGIRLIEPGIHSMGESIWYCFVSCTTIGFGDFVAVTLIGRILTIALALYAILIIALIPGVLVSYFIEFNKVKAQESVVMFLEQLEHLDELSKEELKEISKKVKKRRYKTQTPL